MTVPRYSSMHLKPPPHDEHGTEANRLQKLLTALPSMSHSIVDDCRHEKVLSYLTSSLTANRPRACHDFMEWNALGVIRDCTSADADYRVTSVALRLLGSLIENDNDSIALRQLLDEYEDVLEFAMTCLGEGNEPLLRYSSLEAICRIVDSDEGARWLTGTGKCSEIVSSCLVDSSSYVVSTTCNLLSIIVNGARPGHDELLRTIDLVPRLRSMLDASSNEDSKLGCLDFLWKLAGSRTARAEKLLRDSRLLYQVKELLSDENRIIRHRTSEILTTLLSWTEAPSQLFFNSAEEFEEGNAMHQCFHMVLRTLFLPLITDKNVGYIPVSSSVLKSTVNLVPRCSDEGTRKDLICCLSTTLRILLWALLKDEDMDLANLKDGLSHDGVEWIEMMARAGVVEKIRTSFRKNQKGDMYRKQMLDSVIATIQSIGEDLDTRQRIDFADKVCIVLETEEFRANQKLLKTTLGTLIVLLTKRTERDVNGTGIGSVTDRLTTCVLQLLESPTTSARCMCFLLETLEALFEYPETGRMLCDREKVSAGFVASLNLKVYDREWDVRDTVLEFFARVFEKRRTGEVEDFAVRFAIENKFPAVILRKIGDQEAYVRASCLKTLQAMITHPTGWTHLSPLLTDGTAFRVQGNGDEKGGKSGLEILLTDTEAFVKRAALDLVVSLIRDRGHAEALLVGSQGEETLSSTLLNRLFDDEDFEVRIRVCELLGAVWRFSHEFPQRRISGRKPIPNGEEEGEEEEEKGKVEGSNRRKNRNWNEDGEWFFRLNGDEILWKATQDTSRLVRQTSLRTLSNLTPQPTGVPSGTKKREREKEGGDGTTFRERVSGTDFVELLKGTEPEHPYSEILDPEPVDVREMMREMRIGGGECGNMDCE